MVFHSGPEDINNPDHGAGHNMDAWNDWVFPPGVPIAGPNAKWIQNGPLGSSRLANSAELKKLVGLADSRPNDYLRLLPAFAIGHDPQPSPVYMGQFPVPLGLNSPNLLVFGRSGSGKTQKVTLPAGFHAISEGWSILYINIKGRRQTHWLRQFAHRSGRHSEVTVLSPRQASLTTGCTLLEGCHDLTRAKELAAIMVAAVAGTSRRGEGAWSYNQAEEWIQSYLNAISQDLPPEDRTLMQLRKVVLAGSYVQCAQDHPNHPVLKRFAVSYESGNQNTNTIASTISEATAFIDDVPQFLSDDGFRCERFAQEGGIVILEIDQADIKSLRTLVTLILARTMGCLQRESCQSATGQVPNKTVIIIDELMSTEAFPGLHECLHTCREQNFCFIAGTQSISQLATMFGDDWMAVLDGFQTQIAMGSGLDPFTARHFSERSGIGTIALPSLNDPENHDGDIVTANWQLIPRAPLLPSDITAAIPHPELGVPATVLLGDGSTPMFQVYLTPTYEEPAISRIMQQAIETPPVETIASSNIATTRLPRRRMTDPELHDIHLRLELQKASPPAQDWWRWLTKRLSSHSEFSVLCETLIRYKATITEFFRAWDLGNAKNTEAAFHYLLFLRSQNTDTGKRHPK